MPRKIENVTVFGASGYTGQRITEELLARSVSVTAVARDTSKISSLKDQKLSLVSGSVDDPAFRHQVTAGSDAVVLAVPAHLESGREIAELVPELLAGAAAEGYRLGIVGGAGTLHVTEGGGLVMDQQQFPAAARPNAESHARLLHELKKSKSTAEWFYLSPPAQFGAKFPGSKTGSFRLGKDVLLTIPAGQSTISAEDYATAFANELFDGDRLQTRFTVGY
jgi:putative NADH-flavin reductase